MWEYEHSIEAKVEAAAVWRIWADVPAWGQWNPDIERIEIDGPFTAGSTIAMTPRGQDAVHLRLAEVREPELFVDVAELDGIVVRTEHRAEPLAGGVRITYRTEITGPAADTVGVEIGPAI